MSDIVERLRELDKSKHIGYRVGWQRKAGADCNAAADEIERLRARLALHDPCNGRMTGEPPRYAPECVVLRAEVAGLREQVQHLQSLLVDADNICKEHGGCDLQDCIDNDGDLYQSQAMADALDAARKGEA